MVPSEDTCCEQRLRHRHRRVVVVVLGMTSSMQFDHHGTFDGRIPAQGTFGEPGFTTHCPTHSLLHLKTLTRGRHIAEDGMGTKTVAIDEIHHRKVIDAVGDLHIPLAAGCSCHSSIVEHLPPLDAFFGPNAWIPRGMRLRKCSSLPPGYHRQQKEQTTYYK